MTDDITNKELVAALRPMYGQGPSIGLKLLWQEALRRLEEAPDTSSETVATASRGAGTEAASETTQTTAGTEEWPNPVPSDQTQASQAVTDAGTGAETETVPVAQDVPVADMPLSSSGRADLRMGHRYKDKRGRP